MRSAMLLAALLGSAVVAGVSADDKDKDKKGTKVDLQGYTSMTPATWAKQTPKKSVVTREYQFALPKSEGDKKDGELVIFSGAGGSWDANSGRWKGFFRAPKGKSLDDLTKESKIKIGNVEGDMIDVSGDFTGPQFDPTFPGKHDDFRLVGIQIRIGDETYHIKFHGPAKTVEKHKKEFDTFLKAFKK